MTGFVAEGNAGAIRGALDDDAALAKYARDGVWSPRESSLFKNLFAEHGGTYLDIGANIGLTVIPIAQSPQVACYAIRAGTDELPLSLRKRFPQLSGRKCQAVEPRAV